MNTKLYQIFYDPRQLLDPGCIPVDTQGREMSPLYENNILLETYNKGLTGADYYGVTSWRMFEKTGLTKKDIDLFIENSPGTNAFLYYEYLGIPEPLMHNIRANSPIGRSIQHILALDVFKTKGIETDWINVYSNYWIADEATWDRYMIVLKKVLALAQTDLKLSECFKGSFFHRDVHYPIHPFIIEYLFGLFLRDNEDITWKQIPNNFKPKEIMPGSLAEVYQKHQAPEGWGDKGTIHHYIENYETLLQPYKDKEFTLLEIGVCRGDSLRMWREYLPKARIIGIDINQPTLDITGCEFHICDQSNEGQLDALFATTEFDVIIDDGSHFLEHMIASHKALFHRVKPGGLYIIEDIGGVTRTPDQDMKTLQAIFGTCDVYDTRPQSKRYDDILMVWKK